MCPNPHKNCTTGRNGTGAKLLHLCSYKHSDKSLCRAEHPEYKHHRR
ncbi:MAG: hypothetical protein ACK56I_33280 [bacterium]